MEPSIDPLADLDFEVREPRWWVKPLLARLALVLAVVGALVLLWVDHAEAHAGIGLTVSVDGQGAVQVAAKWADGHPVTNGLGATLTATSDGGQRVGPVPLRAAGQGPGIVSYTGPLAPGGWSVLVDVGTPGIARCEGRLTVAGPDGAAPAAAPVVCPAANDAAARNDPIVADAGAGPGRSWLWAAAILGLGAVALLLVGWARRSPVRVGAGRTRR
ncbi:MAG TPA: hypothetical protein VK453_23370 [Micromonosporaceae bacterium]|nr:hypothetical protein [Micromonosporaceae bacterium]